MKMLLTLEIDLAPLPDEELTVAAADMDYMDFVDNIDEDELAARAHDAGISLADLKTKLMVEELKKEPLDGVTSRGIGNRIVDMITSEDGNRELFAGSNLFVKISGARIVQVQDVNPD